MTSQTWSLIILVLFTLIPSMMGVPVTYRHFKFEVLASYGNAGLHWFLYDLSFFNEHGKRINTTANKCGGPTDKECCTDDGQGWVYGIPRDCIMAFDGNGETLAANLGGDFLQQWIAYDFGVAQTVYSYRLLTTTYILDSNVQGKRRLKTWKLYGSDDNIAWTELSHVVNFDWTSSASAPTGAAVQIILPSTPQEFVCFGDCPPSSIFDPAYVYHRGSSCTSAGLSWITTRAECELAAQSGIFSGINGVDPGYTGSTDGDVRGCYDPTYGASDKFRFNEATSTETCPDHQVCVCKTAPVVNNCTSDDNCRNCRDGAVVVAHPQEPGKLVLGGGHCVLNMSNVCVDIYTHMPCSSDASVCPLGMATDVEPEYLEPAWYQSCTDGGRRYVMGPAGCQDGLDDVGVCQAGY